MSAKLGLKQKMVCLCLMFSAVGIAVGAAGYLGLNTVVTEYGRVSDISLPHLTAANDMFLNYRSVRIALRTLGLPGLAAADAERAVKDVKQAIANYEATNAEYKRQPFSPGESELYARVEKDWEAFKAVGARALALHASGTAADREKMLDIFFHECPEQAQAYTDAMQALLAFHKKNASQWVKQAHETKDATSRIMLWTVILGVGAGMVLGFLLASAISKAINRVARGLAERAAKVAEEIHHIAEASQNLSSSATQQAAALQQTTAAIDETSSMVDKNAENAQKSSEVSGTSQQSAARGQEVVTQMIRSIEDISNSNADIMAQIEASNREIGEIVKVIGEIGNKTKVINDIVFQTKLLSFNASVEAARAGEQGKGFAVVAEEVGNLAAMSGNAAREISEMLEASVQRVEQIVSNTGTRVESLIRTGKEKVDGGTVMAQRCGEVLDEVVKNVSLVGSLVSEISSASREQAIGVQEISRAMEQLDQAAQENSAASQQSSKTAEALRESVADLHQLVAQLNRTVHGANHPDAARAA